MAEDPARRLSVVPLSAGRESPVLHVDQCTDSSALVIWITSLQNSPLIQMAGRPDSCIRAFVRASSNLPVRDTQLAATG